MDIIKHIAQKLLSIVNYKLPDHFIRRLNASN